MAGLTTVEPIRPGERILALDVLRGFAMLGVLIAYCLWSLGTAPPESFSRIDNLLGEAAGFAIDGKFYTILAFLFGIGFSIQLDRAADDSTMVLIFCRRLAALAAIGLVHALLLRNGDILLPYALTGFLLIPFRRSPYQVIFLTAAVALLVPYAVQALWQASGIPLPQRPSLAGAPYLVENAAWVRYWYETALFNWPINLTLFLFGLYAGRTQLLTRLSTDRRKLTVIAIVGLVGGAALYMTRAQLVQADPTLPLQQMIAGLLFTFHCWAMSSAYVAMLLLALRAPRGAKALLPLAAIGRLALTNYLMQAAVIVPLSLAFGWFDRFTPPTAILLAVTLFAAIQLPFSLWWVRRFQFGPAEWIWRTLAYGRKFPLKMTASDYAPV